MQKAFFSIVFIAVAVFSFSQISAQTPTITVGTKVSVNLSPELTLRVRSAPSGAIIGSQAGETAGCVREVNGSWAKIDYEEEPNGWSSTQYLTVIGTCVTTGRVRVNTSSELSLIVRSSANGARLGTQRSGTEGTLLGSSQTVSGKTWQQVDFDSGIDGWRRVIYKR